MAIGERGGGGGGRLALQVLVVHLGRANSNQASKAPLKNGEHSKERKEPYRAL